MKKLNLLGPLRDKSRRREDRRSNSRRVIKHAFGSEQWVQVVRSSYIFWPKDERRADERRTVTRRMLERRTRLQKYRRHALRQQSLNKHLQNQMLTEEEREMLSDMNRHF